MISRIRLLAAAAAMALSACGGGGGAGGAGSAAGGGAAPAVVAASVDRPKVALAWEQGDVPVEGTVRVGIPDGTAAPLYVGIGAPGGKPDPNIDRVVVDVQSPTAATVRVIPAAQLAAGSYEGTLKVLACADAACARSYAGSPFEIGYAFTVEKTDPDFDVSPRRLVLAGEAMRPLAALADVRLPAGATDYTATSSDPAVVVDRDAQGHLRVAVPGRAVGTHTSTVELRAGARKRILTVEHTATPRRLQLTQSVIDLGALPPSAAAPPRRRSAWRSFRRAKPRDRLQRRQSLAEHRAGAAGR